MEPAVLPDRLGGAPDGKRSLRLWLRLLTCATTIEQRIAARLRDDFGSTLPRFDMLSALDRAGPAGLTLGEVSRKLMVTQGNVTGLSGRLRDDGLIEPGESADRRVQSVPLSHLSIELGHLYAEDFTAGPDQLRQAFARVVPWTETARQISAPAVPGRSPRVSTCFLVDDYFGALLQYPTTDGAIVDYACRPERAPVRPEVFGSRFSLTDESNGIRWERLPSEADVEYLLVENVHRAWQASGDDERMARLLPSLDKALRYCMESPLRWAGDQKLVKRPYTIDTWDFDYTAGAAAWLNFQVTDRTFWGIMHGDNSGFYEAAGMLGAMYRALGRPDDADRWSSAAEELCACLSLGKC